MLSATLLIPCPFFLLKGLGSLLDVMTGSGMASVTVKAGFLEENDASLTAELDGVQQKIGLKMLPVHVSVSVSPSTLIVSSGQTAMVTAVVTDSLGNPVPDGTPVHWFSSAGSIEPRVSLTVGGIATATLQTASYSLDGQPTPLHEWVGKVLITATVPGNFVGSTYVIFERHPDKLTIRPHHRWLAGDVTSNGVELVEQIDGSFAFIPYEAGTVVDIWGEPQSQVILSVSDPYLANLVDPKTGKMGVN